MSFTRFAFGTFAVASLLAGCASSAGTDPGNAPEPASSTTEALNYRAQCHQRCDASYDRAIEGCSQDPTCACEAQQSRSVCIATCDGRHYFPIQCE